MPHQYDTVVIGGGISGLTAAWRLKRKGHRVLLVEANERVGGAIGTTRKDGYLLEHGPFNVLVRSEIFASLLAELGQTLEVVHADPGASRNRFVMFNGKLHRTPSGPGDMLSNTLLTPGERFRMMRGLFWSKPNSDETESLDAAARRRLGNGVAEKLVSALSVGIYGGESTDIEFSSCVPKVSKIERDARSPILAMVGAKRNAKQSTTPPANGIAQSKPIKGMVSFRDGLEALPRTLAQGLEESLWTRATVSSITRNGGTWDVHVAVNGTTEELRAKNVVLAVGHAAATQLMSGVDEKISEIVASVSGSSMVVVNLGFRKEQIGHSLNGYGLLAAGSERACPYLGVLFASSIFPHHAPDDHCVMRVFRGGTRQPEAVDKNDDENVAEVMADLRTTLAIKGEPDLVHICRWPNAIPLYKPGHGAKMRRVAELASECDGLYLAGNYTDAVSIGGCVERGERIARQILNASSGNQLDTSIEHTNAQPVAQ